MDLAYAEPAIWLHIEFLIRSLQDIVDWFTSVRSAKLNRLAIAYPGASELEVRISIASLASFSLDFVSFSVILCLLCPFA